MYRCVQLTMRMSLSKWFVLQGPSQDFFRGTRNSPNRFAPSLRPPPTPEEKKTTTTAFPN